ncbi:hypothetical protein HAX54_016976 [Datura stramonium]|uniref:Uncharacterized protein n=1 Tax=Datura stramonium TaxID=4076 RepID=A0ABS8UL23_DATST|nr:hypothetical protein [Datura stramonium]
MASKGKEVVLADPSVKRDTKGKTEASSSTSKAGPARRFGAKAVEPHGLTWFNTQKEAKYALENGIDEGYMALEFPTIWEKYVSWEQVTSSMSRRDPTSHCASLSQMYSRRKSPGTALISVITVQCVPPAV